MRNILLSIFMCLMWGVAGFFQGRAYELRQQIKEREAITPDAYGIIHHPKYGDYPAEVPFHQGMDIMPGQTAHGTIEIDPHEKGN